MQAMVLATGRQRCGQGRRQAHSVGVLVELVREGDQHQCRDRRQWNQLRPHRVALATLAEHQQRDSG
ncbi:hypothetical protein C7E12_18480, partial [Stenotrophomonas maltophilia]